MQKQKGFSLIELLIVVAIILIIAAIAIPNLLRARMAANESSAVASIRTITTGQVTYQTAYPGTGFAGTLLALGGPLGGACVPAVANRTNEVMKVLTIYGTLALPLVVITGFFGMNLHLPWSNNPHGVWYASALMLFSIVGVLWYFRRKHWF